MSDAALSVIQGVVNRLRGYSALTALVGGSSPRIFTSLPQQRVFPFVNISLSSQPFAAMDFSGQEHLVRVQAHGQSTMAEVLQIRQQVMAALDRQESSLTISGLVKCEFAGFADSFIEDDGKTWQSVIEFTLVTQ